ncbi:MDR family MFS transporter [Arthrobacter sp. JUb115]|uniref:MDR family MFS transporter n=1 Tax=Arthrobacter sp. JUb115 TaxID=2485108 RepID=UPI00105DE479|nr:MDR family MFS transporter [Arthrobacter sp. JUb115]TDU20261.1 EmrB/QacA subfamily drug resistance transporter [Arthrobacter sp. JUb115]
MNIPPDAHLAGVEPIPLANQNEVAVRRSNLSQPTNAHVETVDSTPDASPLEIPGNGQTPASGVRIARVYAALLIIVLLGALDHTIVATALPTIVGELDGAQHMAWVITAYTLAMTVALPVYGRLGDRYGRPALMMVALVIFLGASVLCGFAQDMFQLSLFRGIQGLGGAGMAVLPGAIIADLVPPRQRPKYLGPLGSVFGIATVVSPLVGGAITDTVGWRWVFWVNLPIGLLALVMAFSLRRMKPIRGSGGMDWLGTVLMIIFTCALVGLVSLSTAPGTATEVLWGLGVITAVSGVLFVMVEIRSKNALIPMHMFRSWPVVNAAGLGLVIGAGLFSIVAYLPSYVQMVYSTSASVAGLILLPLVLGMMVSSNLSGWLVTRTGRYKIFPLAGSALATAVAICLTFLSPETPLPVVGTLIALLGFAVGSFMQLTVVVAQNAMPHSVVGGVTASLGYLRELGVTVGTAVFGGLFATLLAQAATNNSLGLPASTITDPHTVQQLSAALQLGVSDIYVGAFLPIFTVLACIFGIGVLLSVFMPEQRLSESTPSK